MTAIGGIWDFHGDRDVAQACARILAAQLVYGRHAEDHWSDGTVALGRRLTNLLPEDIYDNQPIVGKASGFVVVSDLRIDNRDELASELSIARPRASTMCDAALLLAAFERWDDQCCDRLVGDYAFAIWEPRTRRLVLARDIVGSRPLHYYREKGSFVFASMPKGLHALAEIPRVADEERLAEFLALLPEYGSQSFFKGIERVEPGHVVTVTESELRVHRHWNWQRYASSSSKTEEYVDAFRHHLDRAVESRLRGSGGQVATHLSAGLDSSAVATTAARLLAPSGGKVIAFTAVPRVGYQVPAQNRWLSDEGPLAAATASMHSNIEHVLIRASERSPVDMLDRKFFLYERPVLNLCNGVWTDAINDEIRARGLTVLLTGHLGNASISYNGRELLSELVRSGNWVRWGRIVTAIVRARQTRVRGALMLTFAPWLPNVMRRFFLRTFQGQSHDLRRYSAINPSRLAELNLKARTRSHGLDFGYRPWKDGVAMRLWMLERVDAGNYNKGVLAGWGVDVRDPTADRRLIEFCLSVPTEQFFRDGVPRALARAALADRVPIQVLNERRRGLQAVDWHESLTAARRQLVEELTRLEQTPGAIRALDLARMRRLVENWPEEGWEKSEVVDQYRSALLRGISVGHFLRRASGGNG